jgi:hypothetical protein
VKKLTSQKVIGILREEYESRLRSQLLEVNVFDSRGTLIIGNDLKVIHKPSGYVYTVKGVTGEPGSAKVVLRNPEEPRVEPPGGSNPDPLQSKKSGPDSLLASEDAGPEKEKKEDKKDYGKRAHPNDLRPPKQDSGETMFVVDQKEFEKYYKEA